MNDSILDKLIEEVKYKLKDKLNNVILALKSFFLPLTTLIDNFLEHKLRYSILLILLIFCALPIIYLFFINRDKPFIFIENIIDNSNIVDQLILIKGITLNNIYTFIGIIIIIITAIWAMFQYDKSLKLKQQEKGSNIFDRFANELIDSITIIDQILNQYENTKNILYKLNKKKTLNFSIYESERIFSEDEILDYNKFWNKKNLNELYQTYLNQNYTENQSQKYPIDFSTLVLDTLNKLEVVCMDISSNVAGSQFIYPSLHTLFLKVLQMLYIKISYMNINNVDTMYINVIHVYNLWIVQRNKDIHKLKKSNKKIKKIQKKSEKEIDNLIHKKPKTV